MFETDQPRLNGHGKAVGQLAGEMTGMDVGVISRWCMKYRYQPTHHLCCRIDAMQLSASVPCVGVRHRCLQISKWEWIVDELSMICWCWIDVERRACHHSDDGTRWRWNFPRIDTQYHIVKWQISNWRRCLCSTEHPAWSFYMERRYHQMSLFPHHLCESQKMTLSISSLDGDWYNWTHADEEFDGL